MIVVNCEDFSAFSTEGVKIAWNRTTGNAIMMVAPEFAVGVELALSLPGRIVHHKPAIVATLKSFSLLVLHSIPVVASIWVKSAWFPAS
jgi:hypothetical protein